MFEIKYKVSHMQENALLLTFPYFRKLYNESFKYVANMTKNQVYKISDRMNKQTCFIL